MNDLLPLWSLWFVPTEKGIRAFGWRPHRIGKPFRANQDDAQEARYLHDIDERAPDKNDYRRIELRAQLGAEIPA